MSEKENNKYKTPLRKLVNFFEQSRNQWKNKSIKAKSTIKRLSNRVRYLETTKSEWKQRAILFEKELKQLRLQTEKKTEELELKKPIIQPTTKTVPTGRFEIVPFHHKYSVDHIMLCLSFVLSATSSLRGASRCLETVRTCLQLSLPVPSWYTIRFWLLRLGYYKLTRAKELATDWIWIIDHTIQLGEEKALVILGIRMRDIPSDSCLKYEDMEPITLLPIKHSNGEIVYEQLKETIDKTGVPREIIGDYGSDLKVGVETFCRFHP